jgi:hypothetical protein
VLPRLAWWLTGFVTVLVSVDVVVSAQAVPLTSEVAVAVHGFPFVHAATFGCALMGALIVARYPHHPIGWLLVTIGVLTSISLLTEAWSFWVLEEDGPGPRALGNVAAWVSQLAGGQLSIFLIALMYLLAPDGRFASRPWRYVALLPAAGALACLVGIGTVDPTTYDLVTAESRYGPVRTTIVSAGFITISLGVVLGLVSMLRRLRRSTGEERQQLRLIALSAALAAVGLVVLFVGQAVNGGRQTWVSGVPLFVAFSFMPALFAVAALRYRLYELDVILNRTVVVAAGTAFAALGYTTLVVAAGRLVQGRTGSWVSFLATVLVALAFQPLRRSVVRLANRLAYGARAQPYEALADFSRRLADAPAPDDLLPAVAEAASRAVSGRGARATLELPGGPPVSGTWGWLPEEPDHVVPVRAEGRELGRIAVALPRGRDLRPGDRRLLDALADQTAVAFGNTVLAGALADRVAELDRTTQRLAGSRGRLIAADDAGRRALEAAIARDVLPFLRTLPVEVARARAAVARGAEPGLDRLVDGTNGALEALRELTRGVYPAQLERSGLAPTLRALVARAPAAAELSADGAGRYPPRVEAAVYFCCTEALRAAHGPVALALSDGDGELVLRITGGHDGVDLVGVADRVEAAGGALRVVPDRLELRVPVTSPGSVGVAPGR